MVDTSVSYPSGDPVISVSPTGLITAIGPGIGFDTTSRLITAREPGVATLTAIVSYGLPGSSASRQIELSSVVGVATPARTHSAARTHPTARAPTRADPHATARTDPRATARPRAAARARTAARATAGHHRPPGIGPDRKRAPPHLRDPHRRHRGVLGQQRGRPDHHATHHPHRTSPAPKRHSRCNASSTSRPAARRAGSTPASSPATAATTTPAVSCP